MEEQTAVVVFSGGMDSTVLLYNLYRRGFKVHALTFNYGQRHIREIMYAKATCADLDIPHHIVDLHSLRELLHGSALTSSNVEVPEGHYEAETMKLTVVPNRNAIMLAIAWGYAVSVGATIVATGVHAGDHAIYPDCRPEFIKAIERAFVYANDGFGNPDLELYAPFIRMTKTMIVVQGTRDRVPFEDTWSCYKGNDIHCGKCGTCTERREAFQLAGVTDPTTYEV